MTPAEEREFARLKEQLEQLREFKAENERLRTALASLQKQLTEAVDGNKELRQEMSEMQKRLDKLLFQLEKRNKKDFGKKTERHNPRQRESEDGNNAASDSEPLPPNTASEPQRKNSNHKKNISGQKVPAQKMTHTVDEKDRTCPTCHVETKVVSHDISSQLERLQHSLIRLEHHQEVRSCPKCRLYMVTAAKPEPPFPGSLAGPHLLSSIIVGKFADGLPNYRQWKMFKREQGIIPRSTQCDWLISASLTLEPLYNLMKRKVLQSKVIKTDDTWAKVQDRKHPNNIRKCKLTPYLGDKDHRFTVFDYSPTQSYQRNIKFLESFSGFVQLDAANGFDALFTDGTKVEVGCNVHARRKADEAKSAEPEICEAILDIYSELYRIEEDIQDKEPAFRLEQRQAKSRTLTLKLKDLLVSLKESLTPTNPLREYVDYTLRHWIALTRFLDDPDFDMDNNETERTIKIFILTRKNSLFFGSDAGGRAAAIHLSFVASCERNKVDPLAYLTDVFTRINSMKFSELEQLLPDRWVPTPKPPP